MIETYNLIAYPIYQRLMKNTDVFDFLGGQARTYLLKQTVVVEDVFF